MDGYEGTYFERKIVVAGDTRRIPETQDLMNKDIACISVRGHIISELICFLNVTFHLDLNTDNIWKGKFHGNMI